MARILAAALLIGAVAWPAVAGEWDERETTASKEKGRSPYARVATGHPPAKDLGKVYTNFDLEKMFGIVEPEETEGTEAPTAPPAPAGAAAAGQPQDPLTWLENQEKAKAEHRAQVAEAEQAVAAAKARLANLEKQALAVRNPFAARPTLSDEEKEFRKDHPAESAEKRFERTEKLVEEAREEVRAAEAKLAELRSKRP